MLMREIGEHGTRIAERPETERERDREIRQIRLRTVGEDNQYQARNVRDLKMRQTHGIHISLTIDLSHHE